MATRYKATFNKTTQSFAESLLLCPSLAAWRLPEDKGEMKPWESSRAIIWECSQNHISIYRVLCCHRKTEFTTVMDKMCWGQ
jgi:hypothetical protein